MVKRVIIISISFIYIILYNIDSFYFALRRLLTTTVIQDDFLYLKIKLYLREIIDVDADYVSLLLFRDKYSRRMECNTLKYILNYDE